MQVVVAVRIRALYKDNTFSLPRMSMINNAPEAPTEAASVGVAIPVYIEPITAIEMTTTGHTLSRDTSLCLQLTSPRLGANDGFSFTRITTNKDNIIAKRIPGTIPPINNLPTEVSVMTP